MDIRILGVNINTGGFEFLSSQWKVWFEDPQRTFHHITTINPEFLVEASKNKEFFSILNVADVNVPDGIGLMFAAKFLFGKSRKLPRVTGVDVTWRLVEFCAETGRSMYLVGAAKGVAEKVQDVLEKKFPTLNIVGAEEGIPKNTVHGSRFTVVSEEDEKLCDRIRKAAPDVLLVAFGAPKQEVWIAHHRHDFPSVRIAVGVGGTFDYISGIVSYAPSVVRKFGLEWLYRLVIQPRRAKRIFTAVVRFPLAVLHEKIFGVRTS